MPLDKEKVLVIGLDGADFKFIRPLIKKGRLPNLCKFMQRGAYSRLATTIPPISPSAWTSFSTGKLPSKHGIFDFVYPDSNPLKKTVGFNSQSIKCKTIWELLSERGKTSIIIDVPLQYPPLPIKGIMISRFLSESLPKAFYPAGLYRDLKRKGFDLLDSSLWLSNVKKRWNLKNHLKSIEDKVSLVKYLNQREPWDLLVVIFQDIDVACHHGWIKSSKIEAIYEKLDWAVGEIFKLSGDKVVKFIVSDHGLCQTRADININELLCQLGYLSKTMSRKALAYFLKSGRTEKIIKRKGREIKMKINYRYDPLSSKVYCASGLMYGININLVGRNPEGRIKLQDYDTACQEIVDALRLSRDPDTKEKLFDRVWQNNLAVKRKSKDFPPDIYFIPHKMEYTVSTPLKIATKGRYINKARKTSGFHDLYGIFIALGQHIKRGKLNTPLSLIDLAPTILRILGVPIPYDVDGKILSGILLKNSHLLKNQPEFQRSSAIKRKAYKMDRKKQKRIFGQLKKMGYIR